jgi:endo-1,4-beta-xylanase
MNLLFAFQGLLSCSRLATCANRQETTRQARRVEAEVAHMTTLREKFDWAFYIGASLGGLLPDDYTPAEISLIRDQYSVVTPENCMKPHAIQPREGEFNFTQADALVAFAAAHGKRMTGHTFIWHHACPDWFFLDGEAPASRDRVLARMRTHIHTLAGRYRGQIMGWDVVNEALDDGDAYLRDTAWLRAIGDDYVVQAFRFAREAVRDCDLYYNDYNIEIPAKREKTLKLLADLADAGVRVDAVGIQGHWGVDSVAFDDIDTAITAFARTGRKVMITELDLSMLPWDTSGADPYVDGCPDDLLARQAEQYAELFRLFLSHRDVITRVAFWNPHDGRSWLNSHPYKRTNYPLLFDRQCKPKPAFHAVIAI